MVKVVHVRPEDAGWWALGCRFVSELSEDELRRLVLSIEEPSPAQQPPAGADLQPPAMPNHVAQSLPVETLRKIAGRPTVSGVHFRLETETVILTDCVIQHLNVPPGWPLSPGKILNMVAQVPGSPLSSVRVRVLECRQDGEYWTFRCLLLGPAIKKPRT
jgi:hypothetical protein